MRKLILQIILFCMAGLLSKACFAFTWDDLWWRPDQQGAKAMQAGHAKQAAQLFHSPDWQGVAHYRAGDYKQAMADFSHNTKATGFYNKANALAQMGDYQKAIQAYDDALNQDPQMADAKYNKEIVEKLLKQQSQKQDNQNKNSKDSDSKDKDQQNSQDQQQQNGQSQNKESQDKQSQSDQSKESQSQNKPSENQAPQSEQAQNSENKTPDEQAQAPIAAKQDKNGPPAQSTQAVNEQQQATEQWLNGIPDDPGGLLQQKFLRDHENYQQLQQQGQAPW